MPPKRGRGRGRGRNPGREEQAPPGQQILPGDFPLSDLPDFVATSNPSEVSLDGASSPAAVSKQKNRTVHPQELGIELKQKTPDVSNLPTRPGFGSFGERVKLRSNCFPIDIPSGYIYHYDVEIFKKQINSQSKISEENKDVKKYRCLHTKTNRKIISLMLDTNESFRNLYAAYDGKKNLYTRKELEGLSKDSPLKCEVILRDENSDSSDDSRSLRQDRYEVEIKPVVKKETKSSAINLDTIHAFFEKTIMTVPEEAIMAVETILRHGPCLKFTPIGRCFYYPPEEPHPLGGGLEIWFGYHQSIRLGKKKPLVNVDISATAFLREGPVLNYIADFLGCSVEELKRIPFIDDATIQNISKKLKRKEIVVTHLPYKKTHQIFKLDRRNANNIRFSLENKEEKTIAEYFKERYNKDLEFPNLPCLVPYVGRDRREIQYPIEVCSFTPGQHSNEKLTPAQNNEMIKFTAVLPQKRFREIDKIIREKADFARDRCIQEFDIKISPNFVPLQGRVLDSPSLIYKKEECDRKILTKDGSWNVVYSQVRKGASIDDQWVLLSFAKIRDCDLDQFCKLFREVGINMGIRIERPIYIKSFRNNNYNIEELISDAKRRAKLAVVVLPGINESEIYSKIKKESETVIGLTTSCITEKAVKRVVNDKTNRHKQILSNICLKLNAKMGGENYVLTPGEIPAVLMKNRVIIIGADVNHPGPHSDRKPSLAACVGNKDTNFTQYVTSIKPQINEKEDKKALDIIQSLQDMVVDILKEYERNTGNKPEKIIFYRDGVSEGEFEEVRKKEITSIRNACESLERDYKPQLTFIVVQKRHHVRFIPQDQRDGAGNAGNIRPGTVVDIDVIHPVNFDFFLCSQFGLIGTSRPSHYIVLEDENHFTADDLQKLTFQLCHMYVRCTRSISVPAPVAYAHLAAYRARKHLEAAENETDYDSSSDDDSTASDSSILEDAMEAIEVVGDFKNSMYFI